MQFIPQWKLFYKRWSTWLLSAIPVLTAAVSFMPSIQEFVHPELYKTIMVILSVSVFVALQIKQKSVSGTSQ